jgi:hypothetical protein
VPGVRQVRAHGDQVLEALQQGLQW